jgi:hypothetical protein
MAVRKKARKSGAVSPQRLHNQTVYVNYGRLHDYFWI